ncbi:hypothetical protein GPECTOR_6g652 [Gonium pectorale]|uniref:Protein kinase domain-containing protein n=1 Tax=Gonium pectorale TaxID=33097 RepID=A0A150GV44_GONPE|nr:hypothetical protein GPECTOR_6g652 [Gonium pectorale]|eukprot:KXZ53735.1 hypothetical protein GPECTOR_6g652 [Gonium pectorale]
MPVASRLADEQTASLLAGSSPVTSPFVKRKTTELELLPVTPMTPVSPDVNLNLGVGAPASGGEVQLLPTTLGKGASGRVVLGRYRGQQVAVKLLDAGLLAGIGLNTTSKEDILEALKAKPSEMGGGAAVADTTSSSGLNRTSNCAAQTLAQEVEVLARCQHPNVIRLLAASLEPPRVCLVMELMDTSLERLLYQREGGGLLPLPTVC